MVGGALARVSVFRVGLGVSGLSSCVLDITFVDFSLVDLIFISRYF
jgi:hypothetical protein